MCFDMCFLMMHLSSQLEEAIIEEFDVILPKLGMVNWENVLKLMGFVEQ